MGAALVVTTTSLAVSIASAGTSSTTYEKCVGTTKEHGVGGISSQLPVSECNAWQDFWTGTKGPHWAYSNNTKCKLDPCTGCDAATHYDNFLIYISCTASHNVSHISEMYVCATRVTYLHGTA